MPGATVITPSSCPPRIDLDGKRYIDFQNGWATNPVGNCHPEVLAAVEEANRTYGFHYDHPLRYELAEKLITIMPNQALPRFSFEVSGTEAAESAVHAALCYTQRRYLITFSSSFHGQSLGTKLMSGLDGDYNRYMEAWTGGVIDRERMTGQLPESKLAEPPIQELVRQGAEVVVQVIKDPIGTKGARLTTHISVPSRFLVLLPGNPHIGVSTRIEEPAERERLHALLAQLRADEDGDGYIVRTNAEAVDDFALAADMAYLRKVWASIRERSTTAPAGTCIYEDRSEGQPTFRLTSS